MPEHISEHLIYSATFALRVRRNRRLARNSVKLECTRSSRRPATLVSDPAPRRNCLASTVSHCLAASLRFVTLGNAPSIALTCDFVRRRAAPLPGFAAILSPIAVIDLRCG
jgi:hypothetical protein